MPKDKKTEVKAEPKKRSRPLEAGKNDAQVKASLVVVSKAKIETSKSKAVVLKLPSSLRNAARVCAKNQGLKLRTWIVELIKIQVGKESTNSSAKPPQTA